jgi:hypothetical protein
VLFALQAFIDLPRGASAAHLNGHTITGTADAAATAQYDDIEFGKARELLAQVEAFRELSSSAPIGTPAASRSRP